MRRAWGFVPLMFLAACGMPRSEALQGEVCRTIPSEGYAPVRPGEFRLPPEWGGPSPGAGRPAAPAGVTSLPRVSPGRPGESVSAATTELRADITARLQRRQALAPRALPPVSVLAVSGGGAWGAFSIGFIDGWGRHHDGRPATETDPRPGGRPKFDVVTGVSTGAMLAPVVFLGDQTGIDRLADEYRKLESKTLLVRRPWLELPSAPSLYSAAELRNRIERVLDEKMVLDIAAQEAERTLAVMAVNLDSGEPVVFDLTKIAAGTDPVGVRRRRIIDAIMASAAIPIAFPPVFINGSPHVDGGVRSHAIVTQAVLDQLANEDVELSLIVSGDMKVMRDCVGKKHYDLVRLALRTIAVANDQLLDGTVNLLMRQVGQRRRGRAQYIDAADLVAYPREGKNPVETTDGLCVVPSDDDDDFVPTFQDCLIRKGFTLGLHPVIPWRIAAQGGRIHERPRSPIVVVPPTN